MKLHSSTEKNILNLSARKSTMKGIKLLNPKINATNSFLKELLNMRYISEIERNHRALPPIQILFES